VRRLLVVALVLTGLTLGAQTASAKLVFVGLADRTFTPGELIELQAQNCNAYCGREMGGKLVALVPVVRPASFARICRAKRWPLAHVTRSGRLRFVMPEVATGRYQLVVKYYTNPKMPCRWGGVSPPFRVVGDAG
jgi:hypothetical protein